MQAMILILGAQPLGTEFTTLGRGYLSMPVLYTAIGYASSDIHHAMISFECTAIGYFAVI